MSRSAKAKWSRCAERLGAIIPKNRLHPAVRTWAERAAGGGAPVGDEPWMVALSGGADSLALLLLLWIHWPERRRRLRVLHFNHRLRGRAAAADERFCRAVCAALGVRLRVGRWASPPEKASEAQARAARMEFFARELERVGGRALWFGHQCDDIAETLLMRLARGSGVGGLAAPRPVQAIGPDRVHLRPLLGLKKCEIEAALDEAGGVWRRDGSNATGAFLRNRIRASVLPAWRDAAGERDVLAGAARSRELLEEDDGALGAWAAELTSIRKDGSLGRARLVGKPRGVVRRVLHLWLAHSGRGAGLSRQAFDALLDDVVDGRCTRHSIDAVWLAALTPTCLRWLRGAEPKRKQASDFQRSVN